MPATSVLKSNSGEAFAVGLVGAPVSSASGPTVSIVTGAGATARLSPPPLVFWVNVTDFDPSVRDVEPIDQLPSAAAWPVATWTPST